MNENGSQILKAGDYKIESLTLHSLVTGDSINLSALYQYIEIYEDIFSPYLTAKIHIEDSLNLPERIPIIGQEKVELVFKTEITQMEKIELVFRVYKLDSHEIMDNGKSQKYVLHLITEGGYFNFSEYCGYSLRGQTSKMVNSIFTKHFPDSVWKNKLEIEDTNDNYSFVISKSYTPFKAISWLASKAHTSTANDYSPFLFYETIDGHCFKSVSKIIEDGSANIIPYLYTPANVAVPDGKIESVSFSTILPARYHRIQKLEEMSRFDTVSNIMYGTISSFMEVHDLIRKETRKHTFYESDVFDSTRKLGSLNHFRKTDSEVDKVLSKGSVYFYMPSTGHTVHTKNNPIVDNFQTESLFQKNKYHKNNLLTQKLMIQVMGDTRRRVGDIVDIIIPKIQSDSHLFDDPNDKNIGGKYMITSIKHNLATAYVCKYELSKTHMEV
ncbi:hypothetical protein FJZ55_00060 [Candidatus Woesearchaeota archaeon]|nr:hypothetical protein [Candidatus Woesearchaeota archaeon]